MGVPAGYPVGEMRARCKNHPVLPRLVRRHLSGTGGRVAALLVLGELLAGYEGDLGVEMPLEEVPIYQKMLIRKANEARKIVWSTASPGAYWIRPPNDSIDPLPVLRDTAITTPNAPRFENA